jgi:hypothetical protein
MNALMRGMFTLAHMLPATTDGNVFANEAVLLSHMDAAPAVAHRHSCP